MTLSGLMQNYRGLIKFAREKGVQPVMLSEKKKEFMGYSQLMIIDESAANFLINSYNL